MYFLASAKDPQKKNISVFEATVGSGEMLVVTTESGNVVSIFSDKKGDEIGIARETKPIASVTVSNLGGTTVLVYSTDDGVETICYDANGDGIPERIVRRRNGVVESAATVKVDLVEIAGKGDDLHQRNERIDENGNGQKK